MNILKKTAALTENESLKNFLHIFFNLVYIILSLRFVISLNEEPFDLARIAAPQPIYINIINKVAGVLCQPFGFTFLTETTVFAMLCYIIFHYGAFLKIPGERKDLIMNKILDMCRVVFFLVGTLLLLLAVTRMGVLLYQDLTIGRLTIVTRPQK